MNFKIMAMKPAGILRLSQLSPPESQSPYKLFQKLTHLGCARALEIGPGKVLKGLIKRIAPDMTVDNFESPQDLPRIAAAA